MIETPKKYLDFFLGALSPAGGFRGYAQQLNQQPDLWLYLIKGGPGCGKSTMMKKLAEQSAQSVERIHCSSDPSSLDGVVFGTHHAAILDATAPHTIDPTYPEAKQSVVSLYHTIHRQDIKEKQGEIIALFDRCSHLQKQANQCICSAGLLLREQELIAQSVLNPQKLNHYIKGLAQRLLPPTGNSGRESLRLLSAVTPDGRIFWSNTVSAVASHIVVFHDEYGAASKLAIEQLRQAALEAGYEIYTCICPLSQPESAEHILIPALGLAFLTSNHWHTMNFDGQQTIHCTRFMDKKELSCHKNRLRLSKQTVEELLNQTSCFQQQAREAHNQLEEFYRTAVDFSAVDQITQQLVSEIGLK